MNNQTCAVCGNPCRPGAGITENDERRHIKCPVPDPQRIAQKRLSLAKANSVRWGPRRTQKTGIVGGTA